MVVVVVVLLVVVVGVVVAGAAGWNLRTHQAELNCPNPIILKCAVSARTVGPHVRVAESPTGQNEPSRADSHRRECLHRRCSILPQGVEELAPWPVMGAHDRIAPDLPCALCIVVLSLTGGVELKGGGGAPAAQHAANCFLCAGVQARRERAW